MDALEQLIAAGIIFSLRNKEQVRYKIQIKDLNQYLENLINKDKKYSNQIKDLLNLENFKNFTFENQ